MSSTAKDRMHAMRVKLGVTVYGISDNLLGAVFSIAKQFDNSLFRRARFDSTNRAHEFLYTDRGPERFIVINSDPALSRQVYVYGNYEFGKFEKVVTLLENIEGRTFKLETLVDIGANIGTICVAAVKRGFAARAIAIEPESKNYRALVSNIYLNDLADKITPHQIALGAKRDQKLTLELSDNNSGDHRIRVSTEKGFSAEEERKTVTVTSDTFDAVAPNLDKNSCLIWMDTQGYEGIILQGAQNILAAKVPMVIEFWPYGMKRAHAYDGLRKSISSYSHYYDLSENEPKAIAMSEAAIDSLYKNFEDMDKKGGINFTDLLLV